MKKVLVVLIGMIILAGCSKKNQYTNDLAGTWSIYKVTYLNSNDANATDTFRRYSITFTSAGQYTENDTIGRDTTFNFGTWQFQNSYGQLILTDTARIQRTYTVFDLTGNSLELLKDGYTRYMRKVQ